MSLFNPEFKLTCEKCGTVWYMSAKDIKDAKKNASMVRQLEMKQKAAIFAGTKRKIETEKSLLEKKTMSFDKCPSCGSRSIKKERD